MINCYFNEFVLSFVLPFHLSLSSFHPLAFVSGRTSRCTSRRGRGWRRPELEQKHWSFKVHSDKHVLQIRKLKIGNIYMFILGNYITFYCPFVMSTTCSGLEAALLKNAQTYLLHFEALRCNEINMYRRFVNWKLETFISLFWVIKSLSIVLFITSFTSYSCNGLEAGLLKNTQNLLVKLWYI